MSKNRERSRVAFRVSTNPERPLPRTASGFRSPAEFVCGSESFNEVRGKQRLPRGPASRDIGLDRRSRSGTKPVQRVPHDLLDLAALPRDYSSVAALARIQRFQTVKFSCRDPVADEGNMGDIEAIADLSDLISYSWRFSVVSGEQPDRAVRQPSELAAIPEAICPCRYRFRPPVLAESSPRSCSKKCGAGSRFRRKDADLPAAARSMVAARLASRAWSASRPGWSHQFPEQLQGSTLLSAGRARVQYRASTPVQ